MLKDKRKAPRKAMRFSAWVTMPDKSLHGCVLADISDTGARLDVEDAKKVPDRFMLFLSGRNGKARRYCHVVWRAPEQLGVEFETPKAVVVETRRTKPKRAATAAAPVPETV